MKILKYFVIVICTFLFLLTLSAKVNSQNKLFKTYHINGVSIDVGRSIERISPPSSYSNWTIAGYTNARTTSGNDWMYLKTDQSGNFICNLLLGFSAEDVCYSHTRRIDSSRTQILAGYNTLGNKTKAACAIVDTNCKFIMTKQVMDSLNSYYKQVYPVNQDFVVNAGSIQFSLGTTYAYKILVTKYSAATGNLIWGWKYTTPEPVANFEVNSICYQPIDSSYAITGRTDLYRTSFPGTYDVFILKLNTAGLPIWIKFYKFPAIVPPIYTSNANRIIPLNDGGFAIAGSTTRNDLPAGEFWLFRVNSNGNLIWSNTYGILGFNEDAFALIQRVLIPINRLTFGGYTNKFGTEDMLLGNVDLGTGAITNIFTRYNNPAGNDRVYDVKHDLKALNNPFQLVSTGVVFNSLTPAFVQDAFFLRTDTIGRYEGCLISMDSIKSPVLPLLDSSNVIFIPVIDVRIYPDTTKYTPSVMEPCIPVGIKNGSDVLPDKFSLSQNYPNPFNPDTRIIFSIPKSENVRLVLYDLLGREAAVLVNEKKNPGTYIFDFNASGLSSGVYYYKLTSGQYSDIKKIVLIK